MPLAVDWLIKSPKPVSDTIPFMMRKTPRPISKIFLFITLSYGAYFNANHDSKSGLKIHLTDVSQD
jgi:hypothetical protein